MKKYKFILLTITIAFSVNLISNVHADTYESDKKRIEKLENAVFETNQQDKTKLKNSERIQLLENAVYQEKSEDSIIKYWNSFILANQNFGHIKVEIDPELKTEDLLNLHAVAKRCIENIRNFYHKIQIHKINFADHEWGKKGSDFSKWDSEYILRLVPNTSVDVCETLMHNQAQEDGLKKVSSNF